MRQKNKNQKGSISVPLLIMVIIISIIAFGGICFGAIEYSKTSKTIKEAEQLTKDEKYDDAIGKLELAKKSVLGKTIFKQGIDRELEKNKTLIEDESEFAQGIKEFNRYNWKEAKELFSKVSTISPRYQRAQERIKETQEKIDAAKLENIDDCEKIFPREENYMHYERCLSMLAVNKKDTTICDRLSTPGSTPVDDISACKASVAVEMNDISYCEDIKDFYQKDHCILMFAISVGDSKLCSKIYQYPCQFNQCLYAIAVRSRNIGLCEEMQGKKEDSFCYKEYHGSCLSDVPKEPVPYLGVYYTWINEVFKVWRGLPVDYGVLVAKTSALEKPAVTPGSPADKAGVKEGDIILEINGTKIKEANTFGEIVSSLRVGDKVNLKILREGKEIVIEVILEAKPKNIY